jgi:hypothetical protein
LEFRARLGPRHHLGLNIVGVELEERSEFPIGKCQFKIHGGEPELGEGLEVELNGLECLRRGEGGGGGGGGIDDVDGNKITSNFDISKPNKRSLSFTACVTTTKSSRRACNVRIKSAYLREK